MRTKTKSMVSVLVVACVFCADVWSVEQPKSSTEWIEITSKTSLAYLGSIDSFEITKGGIQAAKFLLKYLEERNIDDVKLALDIYERLIKRENFGGEYTALQWFGEYFIASEDQKKILLNDQYIRSFFEYMAKDDYAALKEYIKRKYGVGEIEDKYSESGRKREAFLEDLILFNNPKREQWEKTSKILGTLKVDKGDRIADVGSGPGYYTFKFAELVGDEGRVFAIDTVQKHLDYIQSAMDKNDIHNVDLVHTKINSIGLTEHSVDMVFMCSLYHITYLKSREKERDEFIKSIMKSLKPGGYLTIVDNALVDDPGLPYHGPYIAKELIIAQLKHYGFHLESQHSFIPQRYVLVFKLTKEPS